MTVNLLKNAEKHSKKLTALTFQRQNAWLKEQTRKKNSNYSEAKKMFKERLLEKLKLSQNGNNPDEKTVQAMTKIQNHKRLSSQEFLKVYDTIWKEGPKTVYQHPDNWRRNVDNY
jgi:DNA relaxase NicK